MNTLNSGSLEKLKVGQSLLTNVRKVEGGKYSLEIAELVEGKSLNVAGLLNRSDERFKNPISARRAWTTGEANDIKEELGIDVTALTYEEIEGRIIAEVNVVNPSIRGTRLRVQVVETTEPTDFQLENKERTVKQITNKDGVTTYFKNDGKWIFTRSQVVTGTPNNKFLEITERVDNYDFDAEEAIAESLETVMVEEHVATPVMTRTATKPAIKKPIKK